LVTLAVAGDLLQGDHVEVEVGQTALDDALTAASVGTVE
jgi:hypothetical protein